MLSKHISIVAIMISKKRNFALGFYYASRRIFWDRKFMVLAFLLIPLCVAIPLVLIYQPIEAIRLPKNPKLLEESEHFLFLYRLYDNVSDLSTSNYYLSLFKNKSVVSSEYYVLGGFGKYQETHFIFSFYTQCFSRIPPFMGIFALFIAWFLFYSSDAKGGMKNLLETNVRWRPFKMGMIFLYFFLLFLISFISIGVTFAFKSKPLLLRSDGVNWVFLNPYPFWFVQASFCLLNSLLMGVITLLFGSLFHRRKCALVWMSLVSLIVTFLFYMAYFVLRQSFSNYQSEDNVVTNFMSYLVFFGPNALYRFSIDRTIIWVIEVVALFALLFVVILWRKKDAPIFWRKAREKPSPYSY